MLPAGNGNAPFIYFARNPSVVPFSDAAHPGTENRAEVRFSEPLSAGIPGTLCCDLLRRQPTHGLTDELHRNIGVSRERDERI